MKTARNIVVIALVGYVIFLLAHTRAGEQLNVIGAGLTTGRRSADGDVHAYSHDATFDTPKLAKARKILEDLDKDERVTGLFINLGGSGVRDADMRIIQGLSKLKAVDLSRTYVTSEGVEMLSSYYPGIRINTNDFTGRANR